MSSVERLQEMRGPRIGDAASLWNFTPAPGWTREEALVLKLCLMKYGIGHWQLIHSTGLLPGKVIQQLSGQTQRLLGQQSLAAFTGLQVDVDRVRSDNLQRTDVQRKSGLIIYGGPPPSRELKEQWRKDAKEKYGLSPEQLKEVDEQLADVSRQRLEHGGVEEQQMEFATAVQAQEQRQGAEQSAACDIMADDAASLSREEKLRLLQRLGMRLAWSLARLKRGLGLPTEDVPYDLEGEGPTASGLSGPAAGPSCPSLSHIQPGALPKRGSRLGGSSRKGPKSGGGVAKKPPQRPKAGGKAQPRSKSRSRRAGSSSDEGGEESDPGGLFRTRAAVDEGLAGKPPKAPRRAKTEAQAALAAALEVDVAMLVDMGFGQRKAKEALQACGGDVQLACEWLFANCS